jgi:nickel transport protein
VTVHFKPGAFLATLLALAWLLAQPATAFAHAVFIFAWPQGDQVCSDSYFSRKSPVRGGTVTVLDASGTVLDSGKTDEKGSACFPRPRTGSDLTLVVEAGEGHRADFRLRAADLQPPDPGPAPEPEAAPAVPSRPAVAAPAPGGPGADLEAVRAVLRQELASQLGPINRALAEADEKSPSPRDIIGGLGWLAGISGLAFWLAGRKPRQKKQDS